jgi:hypothetical protein
LDIQAQVAARRAELEQGHKRERAEQAASEVRQKADAERQVNIAREAAAVRLSTEEAEIVRVEDHLEIVQPDTLSAIDTGGMLEPQIDLLARNEVRRMWTPSDSWKVIGCGSAGVALLISVPYLGVPLVAYALWQRVSISRRYLRVLKGKYPSLFKNVQENMFKL